jgi:hypothetical protein
LELLPLGGTRVLNLVSDLIDFSLGLAHQLIGLRGDADDILKAGARRSRVRL